MAASIGLAAQAPANVTGKWLFTVETSAGSGMPTVTLKQEGEKLTGHYSSPQLGEADLTGSVKGAAITFAFGTDVQGTHLDVTYSGTIDGQGLDERQSEPRRTRRRHVHAARNNECETN